MQQAAISSHLEKGQLLSKQKAPDFCKKSGAKYARGTTLVQPPVARTALTASNKAAAGNGARRTALPETLRADSSGTSHAQGDRTPAFTSRRLSERARPVFIPVIAFV